MTITHDVIDQWANDPQGPVALHLKQKLVSVEGEGAVIFPPTYAGIGYNIDTLSDGTKVVIIDSVGSQANRMEPLFKQAPYASLVPQIEITLGNEKTVSIFDVGHRLGDALVRCSELAKDTKEAFDNLQNGDAVAIARLAPTSLVFGAWDSRGTQTKLPRLVNSIIRAWDVEELTRSAQYNPPINYAELDDFEATSEEGFVHVPSTGDPGGVIARGGIYRDVTVNLTALRRLDCKFNGSALRQYILGLTLVAATDPQDGFLRQGCLLTPDPENPAIWNLIQRTGERQEVRLSHEEAVTYAKKKADAFGINEKRSVRFDKSLAKSDVKKSEK